MAEHGVIVRLSIRDNETVTRALQQMGTEGERALKRLEQAAKGPTPAMQALSAASGEARVAIEGFGSQAGHLGSVLSSMGPGGLAAAAGIGAMVTGLSALAVRSREAIGQLGDLADTAKRVGVAASTLQELRFAVGQNAGSAEGLDTALRKLNASIGDMALNGDKASESTRVAFAALGVSVTDTEGRVKSSVDVLREMADGLAKIEDPATRARIAQDLLGKSFQDVLPLISQGGDAFDGFRESARDAGAVLDEAVIQRAAEANDKLGALAEVVTNQGNRAFSAFADQLVAVGQTLADLATSLADVAEQFTDLENRSRRSISQTLEANRAEQARIAADLQKPQASGLLDLLTGRSISASTAESEGLRLEQLRADEAKLTELLAKKEEEQRTLVAQGASAAPSDAIARARQATATSARSGGGQKAVFSYDPNSIEFGDFQTQPDYGDPEKTAKVAETLRRLHEENLRARGETIQLIEERRDRELESLNDIGLTETQLAEARREVNETAAQQIGDAYAKMGTKVEESGSAIADGLKSTFDTLGNTITGVFADIALGSEVTAQTVLRSFARALIQSGITNLLSAGNTALGGSAGSSIFSTLFSVGGSLLGSLFGGATATTSTGVAVGSSSVAAGSGYTFSGANSFVLHSGGIVGVDSAPTRSVSSDMFAGAPRYHSGGMAGEVPAILQRGEGVFTPAQMQALGRGGGGVNSTVNVTVNTQSDQPAAIGSETAKAVQRAVREQFMVMLQQEKRPGGALSPGISSLR